MFKYTKGAPIDELVARLFEVIINNKIMPNNINVGIIMTILKDQTGKNDAIENTRPITISDAIACVFEYYILEHLNKIRTNDRQFGFKKNGSTQHAIYIIKEVTRIVRANKTHAYATFCDFSKAFDRVNRRKMMHKLLDHIDDYIWFAVYGYYEVSVVYVLERGKGYSQVI